MVDLGIEEAVKLLQEQKYFLVVGHHQSGKSSLIKHAAKKVENVYYITSSGLNVRLPPGCLTCVLANQPF